MAGVDEPAERMEVKAAIRVVKVVEVIKGIKVIKVVEQRVDRKGRMESKKGLTRNKAGKGQRRRSKSRIKRKQEQDEEVR